MVQETNKRILKNAVAFFASVFCFLALILCALIVLVRSNDQSVEIPVPKIETMDRFDRYISEQMSLAEQAARSVPKKFWLDEDIKVGPVPNPECAGSSDDPSTLDWLLEDAAQILDGQDTLFSTDIVLRPDSKVTYYLDESIFAVTWKQVINNYVYTISEVKVSHPTQFRRHLADDTYGSKHYYTASEMSRHVNAVVGSSADHYMGRKFGTKVYEGVVRSVSIPQSCDICYIDRNGDLIFSYRGELMDMESVQKFVDENDISFSISFGPILVDNGVRCEPPTYALGEVNDKYPRAAICQMGPLHYLVVTAHSEKEFFGTPTIHDFAAVIDTFGCQKAYTMDGGNTGAIVMMGELLTRPSLDFERGLSDIIYFCTALPDQAN